VAPIPPWQLAFIRGAPSVDILEAWDPTQQPPLPPPPYVSADELAPRPDHPWSGSWEGFFVLRKNGRDTEVRERFYLETSSNASQEEHGKVSVVGAGTNAYGRFNLSGLYDPSTGSLILDRAYTNMPRKRRKRVPPVATTDSMGTEASLKSRRIETIIGEDGVAIEVPSARQRRAPSKFDSGDEDDEPHGARSSTSGRARIHISEPSEAAATPGHSEGQLESSSARREVRTLEVTEHVHGPRALDLADNDNDELFDDDESVVEDESEGDDEDAERESGGDFDGEGREEWRDAFVDEEANGDVYEGEGQVREEYDQLSFVRHGFGYCVYLSSHAACLAQGGDLSQIAATEMYEGQWSDGKEHGHGTLTLGAGARKEVLYSGEWVDGKMSGVGRYYFPNSGGANYEGDFRENSRHGRGTYTLPSGAKYEGEWCNNLRHGRGTFLWADGLSSYEGQWVEDKRHGSGRMQLANGLCYEGGWAHGEFDGRGVCTYPDGQRYEGLFKNGKKDGRGSLIFPNGASYEGRFRDDRIDGQGTLLVPAPVHCDNGESLSGEQFDEWVIPISFQSDMGRIHAKAGFDKAGM
jgi:hypothetical protein